MLYLASTSPRRRQLLHQLGYDFDVLAPAVEEIPQAGEAPADYVRRVALAKAEAGLAQLSSLAGDCVLAADTEVVLDGVIFGKPATANAAAAMLRHLSDRTHEVLSCVWVVKTGVRVPFRSKTSMLSESLPTKWHSDPGFAQALSISRVTFAPLDTATIDAYLASGEWQGKAGGYAIQGRAAAFISHLDGSYSAVMGLPLHESAGLLRGFATGIDAGT